MLKFVENLTELSLLGTSNHPEVMFRFIAMTTTMVIVMASIFGVIIDAQYMEAQEFGILATTWGFRTCDRNVDGFDGFAPYQQKQWVKFTMYYQFGQVQYKCEEATHYTWLYEYSYLCGRSAPQSKIAEPIRDHESCDDDYFLRVDIGGLAKTCISSIVVHGVQMEVTPVIFDPHDIQSVQWDLSKFALNPPATFFASTQGPPECRPTDLELRTHFCCIFSE